MTNDKWEAEAHAEQLEVFQKLTIPFTNIPSNDLPRLMEKVGDILNSNLKTNQPTKNGIDEICTEILKKSDKREIKLSFILIVTNIEISGAIWKMPVFVIMSGNKKIFIDMNLTLFNSWEVFLRSNDLPSCRFCFPVGGQYNSGGMLKIDFAWSPAALLVKKNTGIIWNGLGFFVAVGMLVRSFFYEIPPVNHSQADSLLSIAHDFLPGLRACTSYILEALNVVQHLRVGCIALTTGMDKLWNILKCLNDKFTTTISSVFRKVRNALSFLYHYIGQKMSYFFNTASECAQHMFVAVTNKVDTEISVVESEAKELLEASRKNNCQTQTTVVSTGIHVQLDSKKDSEYVDSIFKNAKTETALHNEKKNMGSENLHNTTSDLLSLSNSLAQKLGKTTLKEAQDIFEALSDIVKEEFKNKIETYTNMLSAAKVGAGTHIDLKAFNQSLGIKKDPKEHYWNEAMMSAMQSRLVYSIKNKMENLEKQKKILILELWKKTEDGVDGIYRCVGVNGAGKFSANDLIKALKERKIDLDEENLVINETSSVILIHADDISIAAAQELNLENTSEGTILIEKMED